MNSTSTQTPCKLDPELARSYFKEDYDLVMQQDLPKLYDWTLCPDFDNLILSVKMWATDELGGRLDDYYVKLDMSYYKTWPPGVSYVNPATNTLDQAKDMKWFPKMSNAPSGMGIGYHISYALVGVEAKQMICNSMMLEYYQSNHNPTPNQKWNPDRHNFGTTLSNLQIMLRKPYYGGRS